LRCSTFEAYDDLRELDLAKAGDEVDEPLFLVCTHGKHDPCCARKGRPLFEALEEQLEPETVWQSTHVGGDRFAGNVVCLPHGVYYGRVGREEAVDVLDTYLAGVISLAHYRGRSCHPFPAQAAERSIREATGFVAIDDLRFDGERDGVFSFLDRTGARHERRVVVELGAEDYLTCGATQMRRPRRFVVTAT
jgi:Sucrase/ferredoxin-like